MNKMKNAKGFTLVEIMIALLLGLMIVGTTIALYIGTINNSNDTLKAARLNHDLDSAMSLMMNDIKRAGYWGEAVIASDSRDNPFTVRPDTDIQIRNLSSPETAVDPGDCILYSYDADGDGDVDDNEYYGFRLDNNSIDIRKSGQDNDDCDDSDDSWEEMILGDQLNIQSLQFSLLPQGTLTATTRCMNFSAVPATTFNTTCDVADNTSGNIASGDLVIEKRVVNIVITGVLDDDTTVRKSLTGSVQVRNDKIFTQP